MFPYKFKIKVSACPNDCVASIARSDLAIIGTWKGDIRIDQKEVAAYAAAGLDIQKEVCDLCPTQCMEWDGKELKIYDEDCTRCMHCINLMPKALRPGEEKGATILIGGKAPIVQGALLSWVIVPFMKLEPPYDGAQGPDRRDSGLVGRERQVARAARRADQAPGHESLPAGRRTARGTRRWSRPRGPTPTSSSGPKISKRR